MIAVILSNKELNPIVTEFSNFLRGRKLNLEMKNCNMILTEKQQKSQHYHLEKLINMDILQVKKYYLRTS